MTLDTSRTISLRFSESDYRKLRDEAASLGLKPAVLARVIVRASLNAPDGRPLRTSRPQFLAALDALNDLVDSGGGAPVHPVAVINNMRTRRAAALTDADVSAPIE